MLHEIKTRLSKPSPDFWKKVGNYCLIIGGVIDVIGGGIIPFNPVIGGIVIAVGTTLAAVGKFLSSLTIV